ncbi:STAS domain-containing protein [Trichlorobacter lovleyi]|uniref:STAS domain-containing protein n=1 Tax=Trichlorobacter lovleyi TaxID=313985 RepID=UPI0023F3F555|nr:STAS domain-containing protein [Trichlorobacter lovleyi]
MSDLQLTHSLLADGATLKISVAGRLAIDTAAELQNLLLEQLDTVSSIQLDLSAVEDIDLAGMQLICSACRTNLEVKKHFNFTGCMAPVVKESIGAIGLQRQTTCKHNDDLPCIWCGGMN